MRKGYNNALTEPQVRAIRTALAAGEGRKALARQFEVSLVTIAKLARGETYGWVAQDPAQQAKILKNGRLQTEEERAEEQFREAEATERRSRELLQRMQREGVAGPEHLEYMRQKGWLLELAPQAPHDAALERFLAQTKSQPSSVES